MSDYRLSPACKIVGLPDNTTLAETDTSELTQQLRQAETRGMLPETDLFTILREWDSASGTMRLLKKSNVSARQPFRKLSQNITPMSSTWRLACGVNAMISWQTRTGILPQICWILKYLSSESPAYHTKRTFPVCRKRPSLCNHAIIFYARKYSLTLQPS